MHGDWGPSGHARTERPVAIRCRKVADRWEKAMSYKTHMNGDRESHSGIVPAKRSNAGQGGPKEIVEGRPLTDIRSFFDKVGHDHLEKFLRHRIADERMVRLIMKWVKAGVIEDGQWIETKEGTPG